MRPGRTAGTRPDRAVGVDHVKRRTDGCFHREIAGLKGNLAGEASVRLQ